MKIHYVITIHLMRWLTNFYDFMFKWTATAGFGIHPTKTWLSQLVNFKNAIWTWGHFRGTICNKILFQTLKKCQRNVWNASDWTLFHESNINFEWYRRFKEVRESVRDVGGVRTSIHQSWLAKRLRLRLGLLYWYFKWVQEEIPSEEASTLQIGSVEFPPRQCTSPQLHPCHWLFDQDGHQDSSSPSL